MNKRKKILRRLRQAVSTMGRECARHEKAQDYTAASLYGIAADLLDLIYYLVELEEEESNDGE